MGEMIIEDEEFGLIEVRSNARIKRYGIKILTDGKVVITMPPYGLKGKALSFFELHRAWVREHLKRRKSKIKMFGYGVVLSTYTFDVELVRYGGEKFLGFMRREERKLLIRCPEKEDIESENSQSIVKSIILNAMTIEAKKVLPGWLSRLAEQHGFRYRECRVLKMRTRWGSCSASGSIHLSSMLMTLPSELIEFVMIHELSHTLEMNHSARFHELVDRCLGGRERELTEKIKKYSAVL